MVIGALKLSSLNLNEIGSIIRINLNKDISLTTPTLILRPEVGEEKEIEIPLIRAESLDGVEVRGETGTVAIRKEGSLEVETSEERVEGLEKIDPREFLPLARV